MKRGILPKSLKSGGREMCPLCRQFLCPCLLVIFMLSVMKRMLIAPSLFGHLSVGVYIEILVEVAYGIHWTNFLVILCKPF